MKPILFAVFGTLGLATLTGLARAKIESLAAAIDGLTCEKGEGGICVPYQENVASAGKGRDELFAKFPKDLNATPAPPPASTKGTSSTNTKNDPQPASVDPGAGS